VVHVQLVVPAQELCSLVTAGSYLGECSLPHVLSHAPIRGARPIQRIRSMQNTSHMKADRSPPALEIYLYITCLDG
jgi:hypothetical protein